MLSTVWILLLYFQVREHAAGVLASLMKGIDKDLSKDFRDRSYAQAQRILHTRQRLIFCWFLYYSLVSSYHWFVKKILHTSMFYTCCFLQRCKVRPLCCYYPWCSSCFDGFSAFCSIRHAKVPSWLQSLSFSSKEDDVIRFFVKSHPSGLLPNMVATLLFCLFLNGLFVVFAAGFLVM